MTREQAAERLGMKPSEILDVQSKDGNHLITTHDGQRVEVTKDGEVRPYDADQDLGAWEREINANVGAAEASGQPIRPEMTARDVPTGSPEEVLAWVGTDRDRAALAIETLKQRGGVQAEILETLEHLGGAEGEKDGQQEVPAGSAERVLQWVGDDPARARQALEAERKKDNPARA
nr:hypothetical protein GCM10020093_084210 [Planobispora longispora]